MSTRSKSFNSHDRQKTTIATEKKLFFVRCGWRIDVDGVKVRSGFFARSMKLCLHSWKYYYSNANLMWRYLFVCSECHICVHLNLLMVRSIFSVFFFIVHAQILVRFLFLLLLVSFIFASQLHEWQKHQYSRKDLSLKDSKIDILLITGMLSPYASVVEKLHRDVNKERVTMLKVERAGDVLVDAVSPINAFLTFLFANI